MTGVNGTYDTGEHTIDFEEIIPTGPPTLRVGEGKSKLDVIWRVIITARKESDLEDHTDVLITQKAFDKARTGKLKIGTKEVAMNLKCKRVVDYENVLANPKLAMSVNVSISNNTGKKVESIKLKVIQIVRIHLGEEERYTRGVSPQTPNKAMGVAEAQLEKLLFSRQPVMRSVSNPVLNRTLCALKMKSVGSINRARGKKYITEFQASERMLNSKDEMLECAITVRPQPDNLLTHRLAISKIANEQDMQLRNAFSRISPNIEKKNGMVNRHQPSTLWNARHIHDTMLFCQESKEYSAAAELEDVERKLHICPSFIFSSMQAQLSVSYIVEGKINIHESFSKHSLLVKLPIEVSCDWTS
eukprot:CFRG8289T1